MKAEEAEILMQAWRPGKANDSRTQKAVDYATGHDTLRARLDEQRHFDEHIGEIIRCIQPPEDLRKKLAALNSERPAKRAHFSYLAMLPVLAGVLVLIGIAVFFQMRSSTHFEGREAVENLIEETASMSGVELEPVESKAGQLGDWFYMRGFESFTLPPDLAALPAAGSRVAALNGHSVAQVAVADHQLLVQVFDASKFGVGLPPGGPWQIFSHEGWVAAVRRQGANCYLLTKRGSEAQMQELLNSLPKP